MGACDFYTTALGKNAQEAFQKAQYEDGHGYTGLIAEKNSGWFNIRSGSHPEVEFTGSTAKEWDTYLQDYLWRGEGCLQVWAQSQVERDHPRLRDKSACIEIPIPKKVQRNSNLRGSIYFFFGRTTP